jgi:hypothetical protein
MNSTDSDELTKIGRGSFESIAEMVKTMKRAERLADLARDRPRLGARNKLLEYERQAESARVAIEQDPLSIEFRSGWVTDPSEMEPYEFMILLSTGGPATRIIGELDHNNQPYRARLEAQDWFTPWQTLVLTGDEGETLLEYVEACYQWDCLESHK